MTLDEHIGRKLRSGRAAVGLSTMAAASKLGIEVFHLKQIEAGHKRASATVLSHAAQAYEVEISWFFDFTSPPEPKATLRPEDKTEKDAKSILLLKSLRTNRTLTYLCEAMRESEYAHHECSDVA